MSAFDAELYVRQLHERIGNRQLTIEMEATPTPGGSFENTAHTRSVGDHLQQFVISYDPEQDEDELRIALLHEVIHVTQRHIGAAITRMADGPEKMTLVQALEEDTEEYARRQLGFYRELGIPEAPRALKENEP